MSSRRSSARTKVGEAIVVDVDLSDDLPSSVIEELVELSDGVARTLRRVELGDHGYAELMPPAVLAAYVSP